MVNSQAWTSFTCSSARLWPSLSDDVALLPAQHPPWRTTRRTANMDRLHSSPDSKRPLGSRNLALVLASGPAVFCFVLFLMELGFTPNVAVPFCPLLRRNLQSHLLIVRLRNSGYHAENWQCNTCSFFILQPPPPPPPLPFPLLSTPSGTLVSRPGSARRAGLVKDTSGLWGKAEGAEKKKLGACF